MIVGSQIAYELCEVVDLLHSVQVQQHVQRQGHIDGLAGPSRPEMSMAQRPNTADTSKASGAPQRQWQAWFRNPGVRPSSSRFQLDSSRFPVPLGPHILAPSSLTPVDPRMPSPEGW